MAQEEAARRSGGGAPFVVKQPVEEGREADSRGQQTVGGFVVTDASGEEGSEASVTLGVEQPLPRSRRCSICGQSGHTARTCQAASENVTTRAARKPSRDAVGTLAPMVVGTMNFCVVTTFGAECGLTDLEGKLLIPSMQRTLERMPAAAAQRASVIIDPLVILTVLIMWGKRIGSIKAEQVRQKYVVQPAEAARANGAADTVYSVPATPYAGDQAQVSPTANGIPESIRSGFRDDI